MLALVTYEPEGFRGIIDSFKGTSAIRRDDGGLGNSRSENDFIIGTTRMGCQPVLGGMRGDEEPRY